LAEAEQVTCKFGRSLAGSESQYQDAIYAGQWLYSILPNHMLRVLDVNVERLIKAPFLDLVHHNIKDHQLSQFWLSTTDRKVIGTRVKKRKRIQSVSSDEVDSCLPNSISLALTLPEFDLELNVLSLFGELVIGSQKRISWKDVVADKTENGHYSFSYDTNKMKERICPEPFYDKFDCALDCKLYGMIQYVALHSQVLLAKSLFQIIESPTGAEQIKQRDGGIEYYFITFKVPKTKKRKHLYRQLAVAIRIGKNQILLALLNQKYYSREKEYFILQCP
jgi:hypothetical protein